MSHHNDDDDVIILNISNPKLKGMPEDIREKVEAILEKANKDIEAILGE